MRTFLIALLLMLFIITPCVAKTPDGYTPHEETICNNETGAAFGLCNAYCEAMDCDSENPHASEKACSKIKSLYTKHTGNEYLPCEQNIEQLGCPCLDYIPKFADFLENIGNFDYCLDFSTDTVRSLLIGDLDGDYNFYVMTNNIEGETSICEYSDGLMDFDTIEITYEELDACEKLLLEKIYEAGLSCY